MNKSDWVTLAADAIEHDPGEPRPNGEYTKGFIRNTILKFCPFKPDVAYMPVPRCGSCLHWDNIGQSNMHHGKCLLYDHDASSLASFAGSVYTHENFGCVAWKAKS